ALGLTLGISLYGMANLLNLREKVPSFMLGHEEKPLLLLLLSVPIFYLGIEFLTPMIGLNCQSIIGRLGLAAFFAASGAS
ncbi:hypothetical protein RYX56_25110, partial [Alkalihalophilus lindianensis]